ncbi:MAG: sulfatase-like hydrolase/transferase, partial [bacterium]|nr:sulfatase-like hydrolase/transferase [bacterium]
NVVLITLDTTRADRLGCYNPGKNTSPNLDRLAEESTVFELAIAQAAVTPVSHASIMTGLEPYHHGLRVLHGLTDNRLNERNETLAEVWKDAGGQTAAFISAFPAGAAFGLHQGFEHFDAQFPLSDGEGLRSGDGILVSHESQRRADFTTEAAISWLKNKRDPKKPLLMWVHYFDPHDSTLVPPSKFHRKFRVDSEKSDDILRALYDCEVFFMDSQIGRLLNAFKQGGLWESLAVVVVADHGEGLGDHGWWSHGILYQEQIRVPQIVRIPGVQGGNRIKSLVRTIDLMPTILDAAGIAQKLWPDMDGRSLMGAILDGRMTERSPAYADSVNMLLYPRLDRPGTPDKKDDKFYCVIEGSNKLIYHQLEPHKSEFYDLAKDPGELNNLAAINPPEMAAMIQRLKKRNALSDIITGERPAEDETSARLKSLGYLQ